MSMKLSPFEPTIPFTDERRVEFWRAPKVRDTFIEYFCQRQGHTFVPSSSTIPHDDPTLLFANSGMTQFKPIFQGVVDPRSEMARLKRAANSQKCIRAGGKHNDLEDVGKDVYHHTFFEMLGNWSFGDYFKSEAIDMAWELLTDIFGMPKERLYVTYFGGNEALGLPADLEARDLWIAKGLPSERVLPYGMKENFWEMGESGPCGPCSEIHFDRIGGRDAAALVNADDPDVLEIWNLVFMQYNRETDGSLRPLPNKHVDTGAGLERVVSVLQCKRSNYDTDVFAAIFEAIRAGTGARPYAGGVGSAADPDGVDMAYRVIADHIRTLSIAISDGGMPSNEGRGYVLRRILRRAIRYAHEKLNAPAGFFASLVDVVVEGMGAAFPELARDPESVKAILLAEETQFRKTLERGLQQFGRMVAKLDAEDKVLSGEDAWRLYDTYGFPVDLTRLMAEERGLRVDEPGFLVAQEAAREASKGKAAADQAARPTIDVHVMAELEAKAVPLTDDAAKYTDAVLDGARVVGLLLPGGSLVTTVDVSVPCFGLLLDRTNFYAESGGQLADTGAVSSDELGMEMEVEDVQVYGGFVLHVGRLKHGALSLGDSVSCAYDELRRRPMRANHTGTHLLNWALRQVCPEADQRGSLVAPDRLRFDYAIKTAPSPEQLVRAEQLVNEAIKAGRPVRNSAVPLASARQITGLRAVFGEVYPDPVRVVAVVDAEMEALLGSPTDDRWSVHSVELCGGTHVSRTADIQAFRILSDSPLAKGIRRIVAVTGEAAARADRTASDFAKQLSALEAAPEDSAVRQLGRALEEASVSLEARAALKARLEALRRILQEADKTRRAAQQQVVVDAVAAWLQAHPAQPALMTARFDVGDNGKALLAGLNALKDAGRSGLLLSSDPASGKLHYHALVCPEHLASGAVPAASALCQALDQRFGGKSGGKEATAMGSAPLQADSIDVDALAADLAKKL